MNFVTIERLTSYVRQHAAPAPPDGQGLSTYSQGWNRCASLMRTRIIEWLVKTVRKEYTEKREFMSILDWRDGPPTTNRFPYAYKDGTGEVRFANEGESVQTLFPIVAHAYLWTDKEHRNGQS